MLDEETTQNTLPETPSTPTSPQPPTEATPEITPISEPPTMPPEALETPRDNVSMESNKEAPPKVDEIRVEMENEPKTLENEGIANPAPETVNSPMEIPPVTSPAGEVRAGGQPVPAPEELKAQTSTNDPLTENTRTKNEPLSPAPVSSEAKPEVVIPETKPQPPSQTETKSPSVIVPVSKNMKELLKKEHQAIKNKRNKKLEQVLALFAKRTKLTNDEVEKLLHVSDSTSTRYLRILVKEGKIKRNGKERGKYVSYSKL